MHSYAAAALTCLVTTCYYGIIERCLLVPDACALTAPLHGTAHDESWPNVTYTCLSGYELFGNDTRTCVSLDTWEPDTEPTCERKLSLVLLVLRLMESTWIL